MKILKLIFLVMAGYGFVMGMHGGALLALGMAAFTHWAGRVMDSHDAAAAADPCNARSTCDALCEHECECMRDTQ